LLTRHLLLAALFVFLAFCTSIGQTNGYVRINQAGYLPADAKIGLAFSGTPLRGDFVVRDNANRVVFRGPLKPVAPPNWGGSFPYYYELDFSSYRQPGRHFIQLEESRTTSRAFPIGSYPPYQDELLLFMRQQRCGYNPYLDMVCHMRDGRTVYAPVPDGSFMDASGGWHDAGDQLKYLITASNATARMLLSFELARDKFKDAIDGLGRPQPNRIPDVLDEAKWGLIGFINSIPLPTSCFIRSPTIEITGASSYPIRTSPIMAGDQTVIARSTSRMANLRG
jgi:endoglucanase